MLRAGIVILCLGVLVPIGRAQSDPKHPDWIAMKPGSLSAQKFLQAPDAWQNAYTVGLIEGVYASTIFVGGSINSKPMMQFLDCIKKRTFPQLTAIILKHLKENPERWHESVNLQASLAIIKTCSITLVD